MHKIELKYLGTGAFNHIEAMVTTAQNRRITKKNLIKEFQEVYLALNELIDAASVGKDTSVLMEAYRSKSVECSRAIHYTEYPNQLNDTIVYSTISGIYIEVDHNSDVKKVFEAYTDKYFAKILVEAELHALKKLPHGELIPIVLWFKKNIDKVIAREIPIEPLDEMFSHLTAAPFPREIEFLKDPQGAWKAYGTYIIYRMYTACKNGALDETVPLWMVDSWLASPCKPSYEKYPQ